MGEHTEKHRSGCFLCNIMLWQNSLCDVFTLSFYFEQHAWFYEFYEGKIIWCVLYINSVQANYNEMCICVAALVVVWGGIVEVVLQQWHWVALWHLHCSGIAAALQACRSLRYDSIAVMLWWWCCIGIVVALQWWHYSYIVGTALQWWYCSPHCSGSATATL